MNRANLTARIEIDATVVNGTTNDGVLGTLS